MDCDGDIDLVCGGKTGLYWFENPRIADQTAMTTPKGTLIELELNHMERVGRANARVAAKQRQSSAIP